MVWLKIPTLVDTDTAGDDPTPRQKSLCFVATNRTGNCPRTLHLKYRMVPCLKMLKMLKPLPPTSFDVCF